MKTSNGRTGRAMWTMSVAALVAAAWWTAVPTGTALAEPQPAKDAAADEGPDMLIFKDGKVFKGTVISETATTVKFKGKVSGLDFETEYSKADILSIKKGERKADGAAAADPKTGMKPVEPAKKDVAAVPASNDGKVKYYWVELHGELGSQISETPLREAFRDARQMGADTIILDYQPVWKLNERSPLPELTANFDEMFRAERIAEIFTDDVKKDWTKQPRIVMWVKDAMGGAALLPIVCKELYFKSDARMGGLGNLGGMFGGMGDEIVRKKQESLRLGHAEGWCIAGGYDFRLIRAMCYREFVLSYRTVDGKVEMFEGYPSNAGEELLTDDGKEQNQDTVDDILRGGGNDVLTINARLAEILGLSRKTVDSKDDLLAAMDIAINSVELKGRAKAIMKDWDSGVEGTKRQLIDLIEKYRDVRVQPPADFSARSKARGQQRSILENMVRLIKGKFSEGLSPRWLGENGIPPEAQLNIMLEQIKIQQTKDKK
ncbi:MAG: hypothetical protein NTV94_02705 [Planctomycetota bacterium]|nr:hypothetical protein [Planctomycetota bacterium]